MSETIRTVKPGYLVSEVDFVDTPWPDDWSEVEQYAPRTAATLKDLFDHKALAGVSSLKVESYPTSGSNTDVDFVEITISRRGQNLDISAEMNVTWDSPDLMAETYGLKGAQVDQFVDWYADYGPRSWAGYPGVACAWNAPDIKTVAEFQSEINRAFSECGDALKAHSDRVDKQIDRIKRGSATQDRGVVPISRRRKRSAVL